jgi:hypothetical protein
LTYTGTDAQFLLAGEHFFPLYPALAKQDKTKQPGLHRKKLYMYI